VKTRDVVDTLERCTSQETLFVVSLGRTADEMFRQLADRSLFIDSLGDVCSVACGVAIGIQGAAPVVAVDTDGSHAFGLASLPVFASIRERLPNLTILVVDNQIYESAGSLPSPSSQINWQLLGRAFSLSIEDIQSTDRLQEFLSTPTGSLRYAVISVQNDELSPTQKTIDGIESMYRFVRQVERLTGRVIRMPAVKS